MKRPGIVIAFAILALVAVASGIYFYARGAATPPTPGATQTGQARIGGPFALTDQDGREVTDQAFRGRFMLVYFGYTQCPDICPLGLETMTEAVQEMPKELAARVQPIFITVDPERDTPPVMKDYVGRFGTGLVGLSGKPESVQAALKAYRVYARKAEPQPDGSYGVDHSIFTYVMGPDGRYVANFGHDTSAADMAKRLAALVGESPATS